MDQKKLKKMLIEHEGIKYAPYLCSAGKITIGIGHNLEDKGISKDVVNLLYEEDVAEVEKDLKDLFDDFEELPEQIQLVLADMRFQMGHGGFRTFRKMIIAIKGRNWPRMVAEMKNSTWYRQTPNRANDLIRMVLDVA